MTLKVLIRFQPLTGQQFSRIHEYSIEWLAVDGEMSIGMKKEDVLQFEVETFTELIGMINSYGLPPKK